MFEQSMRIWSHVVPVGGTDVADHWTISNGVMYMRSLCKMSIMPATAFANSAGLGDLKLVHGERYSFWN